jgi:serine/threonine protein kinase
LSEIEILKKLYHISLPRIIDVFKDEQGIYIVESNIEGTNLDKLIKQYGCFEIGKVIDWSLELCDILGYLHGIKPNPIIYGDMKPSNIILTQGNRLALVDFGISKEYSSSQIKDCCIAGTSAYAAPEQLIKDSITDQRTDIYNLGATMYQLLHGKVAKGNSERRIQSKGRAIRMLSRIIVKCMESKRSDRFQKVEEIRKELLTVKNMLLAEGARKRLLLKLEIAAIIMLSIASYTSAVLGLMDAG